MPGASHGHLPVRTDDRGPDDGSQETYGPGDVFVMEPGHDAWTVGSEACVLIDTGVVAYAKPA